MAVVNFIGTTGVLSWATAALWDTGSVPANGDTVVINQGNANIQTGLSQSAVTLANLTIGPNFTGTIGSSATPFPAPLAIGVSGTFLSNSQSAAVVINFGSTTPTIVVLNTGTPFSSAFGSEALQIIGGGAGTTLAVSGSSSSVGVATQYAGLTATITPVSVEAGTVNLGSGLTATNIYHTGGTLTTFCAATLLNQSGSSATTYTLGTVKIATINATANLVLGNRPASGVAMDTLTIGPGATVDASQNPVFFQVTNSIQISTGGTFTTFSAAQCQISGGGNYKIVLQGNISPSQITLNTGGPCAITVGAS